jgi:hypothetical protein
VGVLDGVSPTNRGIETDARNSDATVLPSFAQPDAQTVMRYASALEQELEQGKLGRVNWEKKRSRAAGVDA